MFGVLFVCSIVKTSLQTIGHIGTLNIATCKSKRIISQDRTTWQMFDCIILKTKILRTNHHITIRFLTHQRIIQPIRQRTHKTDVPIAPRKLCSCFRIPNLSVSRRLKRDECHYSGIMAAVGCKSTDFFGMEMPPLTGFPRIVGWCCFCALLCTV